MYIYADFCIIYHAVWSENVTDQQKNEEDVLTPSPYCLVHHQLFIGGRMN